MDKKRMEILRLLYEQHKEWGLNIHAEELYRKGSKDTLGSHPDYKFNLRTLIVRNFVEGGEDGAIKIHSPGIEYYEREIRPWYLKVQEAVTSPKRFAGFVYAAAGIILGAIIGYLLRK